MGERWKNWSRASTTVIKQLPIGTNGIQFNRATAILKGRVGIVCSVLKVIFHSPTSRRRECKCGKRDEFMVSPTIAFKHSELTIVQVLPAVHKAR